MMIPEKRVEFTLGENISKSFYFVTQPIVDAIEVGGTIAANAAATGGEHP